MELKRASLIGGTPPGTPRNSMLLMNNSSQMFDLQEFLDAASTSGTGSPLTPRSKRDTIHEEPETFDHLEKPASARERSSDHLKSSQRSVSQRSMASQHSKSSGSLHSSPSITSVTRTHNSSNSQDQVIPNLAAVEANMNNNNNNNSVLSSQDVVVQVIETAGSLGKASNAPAVVLPDEELRKDGGDSQKNGDSLSAVVNLELERRAVETTSDSQPRGSLGLVELSQKHFHQSSGNILTGSGGGDGGGDYDNLLEKTFHHSAMDLSRDHDNHKAKKPKKKGSSKPLNLAELTDLRQAGKPQVTVTTSSRVRTTRERRRNKSPLITVTSMKRTVDPPSASPRLPQPVQQEMKESVHRYQQPSPLLPQQGSVSQDSGELVSWEDFLTGGKDSNIHGGGGPPPFGGTES